ncbi:MAG: Wzz/FepE/Etk N-terminal domain-containing protein, partial [Oscillospiraceae bacterium]|nr:Wzz/FepE/Etk N-terminal domain-containing protein [Oscillospiraceae bacterium]
MEQNLNQDNGEIEIDLLELLKALWRRAWVIVLAVVICGGGAFCVAFFGITPTYEASAMMYVNNSMSSSISSTISSISSGDLTASKSLVDTYIVILGTRNMLEDVIEQSGVDYTYEELSKMIEADAVNSTEIFEVTVTSTDPEEATLLANTIA